MPILDTRPKDARRRMTPPKDDSGDENSENNDNEASSSSRSPKRRKVDHHSAQPGQSPAVSSVPSVHAWLHPNKPALIMTQSPPLHSSSSTFMGFSISFVPPIHITSESTLAKEARRVVRELDIPNLVGEVLLDCGEGAFQDGNGKTGKKGKERIREPDHRMWAVRTLCLKERKDGTEGADDYQLLETYNDDGEKFGGERILRALRDGQAIDVLTVCCRWYGGEMIGPIRFQHIGLTSHTSLTSLAKLVILNDLRQTLEVLDGEIEELRNTLNPPGSPLQSIDQTPDSSSQAQVQPQPRTGAGSIPNSATKNGGKGKYDKIEDKGRLERLVRAKQKTKESLEGRAGWVGMAQANAEDKALEGASLSEVAAAAATTTTAAPLS